MTTFPFLEAAYIAKKMSGGSSDMPETLKIIDEAPELCRVKLGDWFLVVKKADKLTKSYYVNTRPSGTSANWFTDKTVVCSTIALCIYCGTKLKWVGDVKNDSWRLQDKSYTYVSVYGYDEPVHCLLRSVEYGVISNSNNVLTPNIIRVTNVTPYLPTKTSQYCTVSLAMTYMYDQRSTTYLWDGTVNEIHENKGLTTTLTFGTGVISSDLAANPDTLDDDVAAFRNAVMAYVNE